MNPKLISVASQLPPSCIGTDELLHKAGGKFSDRLHSMMSDLGVERRYSIMRNFPEVMFDGAEPELAIPASHLAASAVRKCMEKSRVDPAKIGLVLGVTSSPGRLLPSLASDLFALIPEIPRDAALLPIQFMGCSVLAKVIDVARWYLAAHPEKLVLASFMDAITPLSPPLPGTYKHFNEIAREDSQDTVDALHAFLFGDAATAMLLGAEGDGPSFGPAFHLTNESPDDNELGTVPDGGSDFPVVHGLRRTVKLGRDISARGAHYAVRTVSELLEKDPSLGSPDRASTVLMHTGSKRILDGICNRLGVSAEGEAVASSYRILRDFGNTIGVSVPLMLADPVHRPAGPGLVLTFGLSFSCGAFVINFPEGGWHP